MNDRELDESIEEQAAIAEQEALDGEVTGHCKHCRHTLSGFRDFQDCPNCGRATPIAEYQSETMAESLERAISKFAEVAGLPREVMATPEQILSSSHGQIFDRLVDREEYEREVMKLVKDPIPSPMSEQEEDLTFGELMTQEGRLFDGPASAQEYGRRLMHALKPFEEAYRLGRCHQMMNAYKVYRDQLNDIAVYLAGAGGERCGGYGCDIARSDGRCSTCGWSREP